MLIYLPFSRPSDPSAYLIFIPLPCNKDRRIWFSLNIYRIYDSARLSADCSRFSMPHASRLGHGPFLGGLWPPWFWRMIFYDTRSALCPACIVVSCLGLLQYLWCPALSPPQHMHCKQCECSVLTLIITLLLMHEPADQSSTSSKHDPPPGSNFSPSGVTCMRCSVTVRDRVR